MSSYALINLDEFDAMSPRQQPILKYLLSKHDVKFRPPYGKTTEQRQRYASFIAKTVSQGEVTLGEIAEEACRNSSFSEGDVIGVVTELQDLLKEKLANGQTVVLPGIGRFSLRVESAGVDDPKAFNIRHHITRIVCGFLPAGRRTHDRRILYDFCEGVKAVWQHGFKP